MKLVRPSKHVEVGKVDLEREFYTKQGQHMTNVGKEKAIKRAHNIHHEQTRELINLFWKTDQVNKGNQVQEPKETTLDKEVVTPNAAIYEESAEEAEEKMAKKYQMVSKNGEKKEGNTYHLDMEGYMRRRKWGIGRKEGHCRDKRNRISIIREKL
jgi:hypothetical protein